MRCFRFLVLWVFAGGVEIPLLLNVMNDGHYPMAAVWCGHMAAAALTALAVARWDDSAGFFQKWTGWLFLWALLLPGAGWLFGGILAMAGWNAREPGESIAEEDDPAASLDNSFSEPAEVATARIVKELDFIPLVEILAGDDIQQKRGAIEQLTRLRTKEAVRILMSHRSDPSMEMRFYANASLVRIKREFDEALDAARQQMQMDSDNVMSRLNLAKIYVRMAESGLLDPDLAASHENEAIFHLGCVMDSESPTREAAQTLIVLQMRRRDWTRAEKSIQHAFGLCLISDDEAAEYRAEILYSCGQFAKIKTALQPISADASLSAEWRSTLLWWGLRS